jgi:hypothetical protein
MIDRIHRVSAVAVGAACATVLAVAAPAAADDSGLFGSADPTYDGAYRQGLAITGLAAVQRPVPRKAVAWLVGQQCDNGSFQAYRADTDVKCAKPDPVNFTGADTNSTAMAAMALRAAGSAREADAAVRYLRRVQNPDGGFPYYKGGVSDANSTGLSLAALNGAPKRASTATQRRTAAKYLRTLQLRCSAGREQRGLISYQASPKAANDLATVQAAVGLLTTLPVTEAELPDSGGPIRCSGGKQSKGTDVASAALAALKQRLKANGGLLPSSVGSGDDPSATAQAVLALAAADVYPNQVARAVRKLQGAAKAFTGAGAAADPGAAGTLLLVAAAADQNPKDFGGVNLLKVLRSSQR